jgi:hypothetical protein
MKRALSYSSFMAVMLGLTGLASAQSFWNWPYGYGDNWYGYHHASTFEEGVQRGYAAVQQAIGQRNYLNSLARINNQEAYSRYLKNAAQRTETYFYMRQANREARFASAPKPLKLEQYIVLARNAAPSRLSEQQYNRSIGRIFWPASLENERFAAERDALELAFRLRASSDFGPGSTFYAKVNRLSAVMQDKLRDEKTTLDPHQFMTALNFLRSLAYEARYPVATTALASLR